MFLLAISVPSNWMTMGIPQLNGNVKKYKADAELIAGSTFSVSLPHLTTMDGSCIGTIKKDFFPNSDALS